MVQHGSTIVRNELKAQFNPSKLQISLKQKRLPLCHNEKTTTQTQKLAPKATSPLFTHNACFCIAAPLNSCSMVVNRSACFCQSCSMFGKLSSKKATAKTAQNRNSRH
jgi:hypothetical protein